MKIKTKTTILQLQGDGTITTESLPIAEVPMGDPLATACLGDIEAQRRRLDDDEMELVVLRSIGVALESLYNRHLGDVVTPTMEQIQLCDDSLSIVMRSHDPHFGSFNLLKGTTVSTEGLMDTLMSIWRKIEEGIKRLMAESGRLLMRYFGMNAQVRRGLKNAQNKLRNMKWEGGGPVLMEATPGMQALADHDGKWDLPTLPTRLKRFARIVNMVLIKHSNNMTGNLTEMARWVMAIDVTSDETARKMLTVQAMPKFNWLTSVIPDVATKKGVVNGMLAVEVGGLFGNHILYASSPHVQPGDFDKAITLNYYDSDELYGYVDDTAVQLTEEEIQLPTPDVAKAMVDDALDILDSMDIFRGTQVRLNKAVDTLMMAGADLTKRAANAQISNDVADDITRLLHAIQNVTMSSQQPFRDLMYDALRVTTGVLSLADNTAE